MLNQRLQQKLLQKLSPQQIQMIKLLEVPTLQIEERIKKELEENPALEEGQDDDEVHTETAEEDQFDEKDKDQDEFTIEDYIEDDDIPDYRLQEKNYSKDEDKRTEILAAGVIYIEILKESKNSNQYQIIKNKASKRMLRNIVFPL